MTDRQTFNHVISLGFFCSPSLELERLGFRDCSMPFDWLITCNFGIVLEMVQNHFRDFLKKENLYQEIGVNRNYYWDAVTQIHFYHDFSKYLPLEEQYPQVWAKYQRRIERFYQTIQEPTLFIRYCQDRKEISYISEHEREILSVLQQFNEQNEIIYIVQTKECTFEYSKVFYVEKDRSDSVARKFMKTNPEIEKYVTEVVCAPDRKKNIRIYERKHLLKLTKKVISRVKNVVYPDKRAVYTHSQVI